jgi:Flp pilus assembly protein TadG
VRSRYGSVSLKNHLGFELSLCRPFDEKSFSRDDNGSALVEAAIVIPVLLTLFLGVFEFSALFWEQQLISSGVRDAARFLSRCLGVSARSDCLNVSETAVEEAAKNLAVYGSISGGKVTRVPDWAVDQVKISFATIDNAGGTYRGPPIIRTVTVSTTYTHPSLGFLGYLGLSNLNFSVSHQERVAGSS